MQLSVKKFQKFYSKKKNSQKGHIIQDGVIGLKILTSVRLNESQIKTVEWLFKKIIKSQRFKTKLWSKFNLNHNLTKLNLESRMGKGKGSIYTKAQFIKAGTIFFEFSEISNQTLKKLKIALTTIFPKKFKLLFLSKIKGRETQR